VLFQFNVSNGAIYSTSLGYPANNVIGDDYNLIIGAYTSQRNQVLIDPIGNFSGGLDCYITQINAAGYHFFSTFYGGSGNDYLHAMAVRNGKLYIAGGNFSQNLPQVNPILNQSILSDGFLAVINYTTAPIESTTGVAATTGNGCQITYSNDCTCTTLNPFPNLESTCSHGVWQITQNVDISSSSPGVSIGIGAVIEIMGSVYQQSGTTLSIFEGGQLIIQSNFTQAANTTLNFHYQSNVQEKATLNITGTAYFNGNLQVFLDPEIRDQDNLNLINYSNSSGSFQNVTTNQYPPDPCLNVSGTPEQTGSSFGVLVNINNSGNCNSNKTLTIAVAVSFAVIFVASVAALLVILAKRHRNRIERRKRQSIRIDLPSIYSDIELTKRSST